MGRDTKLLSSFDRRLLKNVDRLREAAPPEQTYSSYVVTHDVTRNRHVEYSHFLVGINPAAALVDGELGTVIGRSAAAEITIGGPVKRRLLNILRVMTIESVEVKFLSPVREGSSRHSMEHLYKLHYPLGEDVAVSLRVGNEFENRYAEPGYILDVVTAIRNASQFQVITPPNNESVPK